MRHHYGYRGFGAASIDSAAVMTVQRQINTTLVNNGFEPIKVDGAIGPRTCGAARAVSHPALSEMGCTQFIEPVRSSAGPVVPAPGPNSPAPAPGAPVAPSPLAPASSSGFFGMDSKTVLIGAGVVVVGVVAIYALKKKSQAAPA